MAAVLHRLVLANWDTGSLRNALESMGSCEYMNHVTGLFSDPSMSQLCLYSMTLVAPFVRLMYVTIGMDVYRNVIRLDRDYRTTSIYRLISSAKNTVLYSGKYGTFTDKEIPLCSLFLN